MRRFFLAVTAALLTVCVGCSAVPATSDVPSDASRTGKTDDTPKTFAVAYSAKDTLDPFAASTEVNVRLSGLLYDGLTAIDDGLTAQPSLASSVTMTDATHWTATLRDDAVFSDGSPVTTKDVVASFELARSSTPYRALLSNVLSATAKGEDIVFTLATPDPQAAACLSYPVIRVSTRSASVGQAPVGSGLYCLQKEEDGTLSLTANPHSGKKLPYQTVALRHYPNTDRMYYGLTSGDITYYYNDLDSGTVPRVSGASAAVPMNALVFLGINPLRPALSSAAMREGLSLLLDRKTLAASAYSGWALPASTPFHPQWSAVRDVTGWSVERDLTAGLEKIADAGYGAEGEPMPTPELMYSTDSGLFASAALSVASALESAGIKVKVTPLDYETYKSRIAAGDFDLYLGEIRLTAAMDLTPLMSGAAAVAYRQYRAGEKTVAEFIDAFAADMPYLPLCWRCGFAAYGRHLAKVTPHGYNVFYGFDQWK